MLHYYGVTFNNIRKALAYLYYGVDFVEEEVYPYVIPMQQNFFNPIKEVGDDTYIQFFIRKDKRLTQDQFGWHKTNYVHKLAFVNLRFVGHGAEMWAKAMHHLTQRKDAHAIFMGTCQAEKLEAIGDITPTQVTFNGKNVHIAFDMDFRLYYKESIDIDSWEALAKVELAEGLINVELAHGEVVT